MILYATRNMDSCYVHLWKEEPHRFSNGVYMTGFPPFLTMFNKDFKCLYGNLIGCGAMEKIDIYARKAKK